MWGVHEGMGWWMLLGGVWMVLFWAILIGAIAWTVSRLAHTAQARDPLEIARARYARGDISGEEFERIRGNLSAR